MRKDNFYEDKMIRMGVTDEDIIKAQLKRMKKASFITFLSIYMFYLLYSTMFMAHMTFEGIIKTNMIAIVSSAILAYVIYTFSKNTAKNIGHRACLSNPTILMNLLKSKGIKKGESNINVVDVKFSSDEEAVFIDTIYKWIVNKYEWSIVRNYCFIPTIIITIFGSIAFSYSKGESFISFVLPVFMVTIITLLVIVLALYYSLIKSNKGVKSRLEKYVKLRISKLYKIGCLDDREYILLSNVAEMSIYGRIVSDKYYRNKDESVSSKFTVSKIINESGFTEDDIVKYSLYEKYEKEYNTRGIIVAVVMYILFIAITGAKSSSIVAIGIGYSVANKAKTKGMEKAEAIIENKDNHKDIYDKALNEIYDNELKVRNIIMTLNKIKNIEESVE